MMPSNSVRCRSCGHEVDAETSREKYGGACPDCLGAFALEGLLTPRVPTPAPSGGEFGKFVLTDRLGKGGMGEVWKAFDKELKRWVALKFLRSESPQELARFQREARTAAALSHPGIAAIYEVGETGGRHYIAMQYVEGRTLQLHPRKDRKGLARLVRDAARALEHAHRHGVIHRDLKPENLIVEKTENETRVLILDFGLAKRIQGGESLSRSGTVAGTLQYMSPEQARGEKLDERADVYSLGATLYEVLTGKPPVEGANAVEIMRRIEDQEPTTPRRLNQHIPHDLETIVLKCLEKDKERRYGGAKELADDLDRFLEGDAVMARRASTWYRVKMRLSKRRAVVMTAGVAALILSSLLGWWVLVGSPETRHAKLMAEAMKLWAEARGEAMAGVNPEAITSKAKTARQAFLKSIEILESGDAHLMMGHCLALEGLESESLASLERACALAPNHDEICLELAKSLLHSHRVSRGVPPSLGGADPLINSQSHYVGTLQQETEEQRSLRRKAAYLLKVIESHGAQGQLLSGLQCMGAEDFVNAAEHFAAYCKEERWDICARRLEGICRFFAKDHLGAVQALDEALARVPHAESFNYRGLAKDVMGLYDEAILDFSKATELAPKLASAFSNRGNAWLSKGDTDKAVSDQTIAIGLAPNFASPYSNRAIALAMKGLFEDAITDVQVAIRLDPLNALAYSSRGQVHLFAGQFDEATKDYDAALRLLPEWAMAYANRGAAKAKAKRFKEAISDCDEALKRERKGGAAYIALLNRGNSNAGLGSIKEALRDYDEALEINAQSSMVYYARGQTLFAIGRLDEAIRDCNEVISRNSTADGYLLRAEVFRAKGDTSSALKDYGDGLRLDPKSEAILNNRGLLLAATGKLDLAISDFEKAIDLYPRKPGAYLNRGVLFCDFLKDYDKAITDFTTVIDLDPKDHVAYDNRGLAKVCKGLLDDAIVDHASAIALDPKFAKAYANRGFARAEKGLHNQAMSDYDTSITLDPKEPYSYFARGKSHYALRQFTEAVRDFESALLLSTSDWFLRLDTRSSLDLAQLQSFLEEARNSHRAKEFREAIERYTIVLDKWPESKSASQSAYSVACCHSRLGEKELALDWLEKALTMGWKDVAHMQEDSDLESLRGEERYKKLVARLMAE